MDDSSGLLHHVELYVSGFDTAVDFYGWLFELLGYEPFQRWEGGRSWQRGPAYIVIVEAPPDRRDGAFDRRAPGLNHLAFHADSRGQVDDLTERLRGRGERVLYEDEHPYAGGDDHYAVYFEGPEGLKLEVVAPEPPADA